MSRLTPDLIGRTIRIESRQSGWSDEGEVIGYLDEPSIIYQDRSGKQQRIPLSANWSVVEPPMPEPDDGTTWSAVGGGSDAVFSRRDGWEYSSGLNRWYSTIEDRYVPWSWSRVWSFVTLNQLQLDQLFSASVAQNELARVTAELAKLQAEHRELLGDYQRRWNDEAFAESDEVRVAVDPGANGQAAVVAVTSQGPKVLDWSSAVAAPTPPGPVVPIFRAGFGCPTCWSYLRPNKHGCTDAWHEGVGNV